MSTSSYLTLRQRRSTKILSRAQPQPSTLMAIPFGSSWPVNSPPGQDWIFQPLITVMPFQWAETELFLKAYGYLTGKNIPTVPAMMATRETNPDLKRTSVMSAAQTWWGRFMANPCTNMGASGAPFMVDSVEAWGRLLRSPLASSTGRPAFDWPSSPGASARRSIYGSHQTDAWSTSRLSDASNTLVIGNSRPNGRCITLSGNWYLAIFRLDQPAFISFLSQSTSAFNWPIWR